MNSFKRLILLSTYNIKLQFRQGFYYAWLFITLFYILGLYFLPDNIKNTILPLIMLSEPSTFAMIFTGAIVLLERDEKMLENLFITPLSIRMYIYSKMISIAIPATVCTIIISAISSGLTIKLLLLIPAIILTTFFFVIFSLLLSVSSRDIMSFIGKIGIYGSIFSITILDYFGFLQGYFQYLLPSKGALVLISAAVGYRLYPVWEITLSLITMIISIILILIPAERAFYRQIILKGGE